MRTFFNFCIPLLISAIISCRDSSDCNHEEVRSIQTYEFVSDTDAYLQNIDQTQSVNLVIKTQTDYDHYVITNPAISRPVIDFEKRTLLAGRFVDPNCGKLIKIEVSGNCSKYICVIVLDELDCDFDGIGDYYVLIDRTNAEIVFETAYYHD